MNMKAVLLEGYGGVDQLRIATVPRPEPGSGEVLVRVHATSVNPIDYKIRSGSAKERFPQEFPAILGRDLAGEVAALGAGVTQFTQGQRVMAMANHTYAEYTVAKADILAEIPGGLDYEHAAALPLVVTTGSQLAERAGKVQQGQVVLVTGAMGSVGRTAVFVSRQHGCKVIAGVRKSQLDEAKKLHAQQVVAVDDDGQLGSLGELDVILDTVGGSLAPKLLKHLKQGCVYASAVGPPQDADKFDVKVAALMAQPDAKRLRELAEAEAAGEFDIPIAKVMPLSEIQEAQRLGESHSIQGKIILLP